ncbi:hypothetical protein AZH11_02980 [Pseudomonas simiae]|nr:hypothetical protein AZH11_02980 [Pseudomonas simiae]
MLKCIPASQVIVGMYIHKPEGAWMEHGFWKIQFVLERAQDLQRLQAAQIQHVWIDTLKGCDVTLAVAAVSASLSNKRPLHCSRRC